MGRDERHGTKITKYTRVYFPSLPSHPLFYANPNSRPGVVSSLSSPRFEATRRSWNGEQTEHFNWLLLCVWLYFQKSHPPISLGTIREFAIPGVDGACAHRKREVWCRYLRILARISSRHGVRLHSFHPRNGELERKDEIHRKLDNVKKEGGNYCCKRRE